MEGHGDCGGPLRQDSCRLVLAIESEVPCDAALGKGVRASGLTIAFESTAHGAVEADLSSEADVRSTASFVVQTGPHHSGTWSLSR